MKPKHLLHLFRNLPTAMLEFSELKKQAMKSPHSFPEIRISRYINEKKHLSGTASGHYFHQDLLVARRIFENNPEIHVDIGSRIDGFVAHVASFREIEVLDIRPLGHHIQNIRFKQADLMSLPDGMKEYCDSLSCLHAIEHFGLGRYGDPIDFEGHVKGLANLYTILKHGGNLYLSCPIGPQRIEFNSQRVFSLNYLLSLFKQGFLLKNFSYVDDRGDLHVDVSMTPELIDSDCRCNYGCGIFELQKT